MKSFDYNLKEPVEVAINGKISQAVAITVNAPNAKVYNEVFIIDAEYAKADKSAAQAGIDIVKGMTPEQLKSISSKKIEITAKPGEIVTMMLKHGADVSKCFDALKNILCAGTKEKPICTIDAVKLEAPIFEQFSVEDTKELLGLYVQSFLDSSRNTSKTS